jgi:hypothetical protein
MRECATGPLERIVLHLTASREHGCDAAHQG